jgi:hypothetical protein
MRALASVLSLVVGTLVGCGGADPMHADGGSKDLAKASIVDLAGLDLTGLDLQSVDLASLGDGATVHHGPQDLSNDSGVTPVPAGLMVTWNTGCWYADSGHKYQAMSFQLTTPTPLPLEGSLYFVPDCSDSAGIDNLNDNGSTIPSGGWTFWFIHHPDIMHSSAKWWIGNQYSVCINYDSAPDC